MLSEDVLGFPLPEELPRQNLYFGPPPPPKAQLIVMIIILLHNYLWNHSPTLYMLHGSSDHEENGVLIEGSWRSEVNTASMIPLRNIPRRTPAVYHKIRD
ncbi:hypothetical protein PR048_020197 [Dryococelus australis]|uniref:Uncharacterized protein n=1 Tax=Dryococelus australis TaxID=614101 RepID=A0ABQ9H5L8_9NEOP|nr:hypothetical protein PR048_020197 [Dryococelus australis]